MKDVKHLQKISSNQLVSILVVHCKKKGLSLTALADELCFSETFLMSMIRGERDIRELSIDGYRTIAGVLGISCFSALIIAGSLTMDDLVDHRHSVQFTSP